MTFPLAPSEPGRTSRLHALIGEARRRARRRRARYGAFVLASLALAGGLFIQIHRGGGGTPGTSGVAGARGDLVSNASGVAPRRVEWTPAFPGFGGIRRPPGGAELRHEHELLARKTAFGEASIWAAPSYDAPAQCTWLKVGRAVWGGMCRLHQPPGRGLLDVVPLRLPIKGRIFNVLWGQVGTAVARLTVRFQNRREIRIPLSRRARPMPSRRDHVALQRVFLFPVLSSQWGAAFLFPLPSSPWGVDDRPALLIARDRSGRTVGRPLRFASPRKRGSARPSTKTHCVPAYQASTVCGSPPGPTRSIL
jgi:hypothetical protein